MYAGFDSGAYRDMVALARHTTWLNGVANRWSDYGLLLFVVLAAAGFRRNGSGWRALWVPGAMVAAFVLSAVTKLAFAEQRPCRTLPSVGHIVAVCPPLGDYAFPSNHAVLAGAGAMAVWMIDRRLGAVAAVNAVVIAAARVYIGVHYPHDVVAGLLLGAFVALAGTWVGGRFGPPVLRRVPPALRERAVDLLGPLPARSSAGGGDDGVGEEAGGEAQEDPPGGDLLAAEGRARPWLRSCRWPDPRRSCAARCRRRSASPAGLPAQAGGGPAELGGGRRTRPGSGSGAAPAIGSPR